mgnify:CR=1 FL=1
MNTIDRLLQMERLVDAAGITQPADAERLRFGEVAVALGYVTRDQVDAALALQRIEARAERPHRMIGAILVSQGALDSRRVSEILDALVKAARSRRTRTVGQRRLAWDGRLVGPFAA